MKKDSQCNYDWKGKRSWNDLQTKMWPSEQAQEPQF